MENEPQHDPVVRASEFRFYAELNDHLANDRRGRSFGHSFLGTPSVKDAVESIGVPHTEVDLILVNDRAVGFSHRLRGEERVAVFPVFERFDISESTRLRPHPLRSIRFIADVHLGRLARYLRMVGFDTAYQTTLSDPEIIRMSGRDRRIILTRDRGLLRDGRVTHGYLVRHTHATCQLREVVDQFHLSRHFSPFTRCLPCNGLIEPIESDKVGERAPKAILDTHTRFFECQLCGRVYWQGSHVHRMVRMLEELGFRP